MLPLRIVVRTDVNWAQMDASTFASQTDATRPVSLIQSAVRGGILDLWDAAFPIGFFEYRARLQALSRESIRKAAPTSLSVGLAGIDEWLSDPREEILVPTDDDDFFSPSLGKIAAEFEPGTDVVLWPHMAVGYMDGATRRSYQPHVLLVMISNNCAIRKSFLTKHFSRDEIVTVLSQHWVANAKVAEKLEVAPWVPKFLGCPMLLHPSVRLANGFHSVYNVHPGSIFVLNTVLGMQDPLGYLKSLDRTTPVHLPEDLEPCREYVRRFEAIWDTR